VHLYVIDNMMLFRENIQLNRFFKGRLKRKGRYPWVSPS
jgi:hypothetical protein